MLTFLIEFFIFAFLGWIVDSLYCSITSKKIIISGYFKGVPLCPIYGFGGVLISNNFYSFQNYPFWMTILTTTTLVILLEYLGGWFAEYFLEEKLWDYSKEKFNLHGYVSLWHSFLWLVAINILYFSFNEKIVDFVYKLTQRLVMPAEQQIILIILISMVALMLTAKNKSIRLKAIKDLEKIKARI